ncbi:SLBB domain-containing protein [Echinicola jeungdonensis]|uniref:SLBB domain-containing protein n=1 Tax=Echinicola jeungdonensis TaxID=709343 RepID=A0ABV5J2U9_9BACT
MFSIITLHAQSLSDIQNVNVDELSDAQIEMIVKKAEEQGVNKAEIPSMAEQRGMPAVEASKLATRINQLGTATRDTMNSSKGQTQRTIEGAVFSDNGSSKDLSEEQKKIYGFSLFHNKKLDFSPNLNIPTPMDYTIGTGDQLLIDVYGDSQQSYSLTVNPEGRIYIPNVGPLSIGGSSIQAATARIKSKLSNTIYSDLSSNNPGTFLQVRLGNIRSIQVSMVGELSSPGNYTLPSFASVFNALYAAGGPNEQGSFRKIKVFRNSREIAEVDVYDFLTQGDQQQNIRLQDNDVIMVPSYQTRVEIKGPVKRPGLFEIKQGESVADLIFFAGGFGSNAYPEKITVRRVSDNARKVADIGRTQFENFSIQDGDIFMVGEKLSRYENRVQISGAVYRPGEFALEPGMSIKDLIQQAEGLKGEAFLNRATLYRTQEDLTLEIVPVNVAEVVNGEAGDIPLKREDVLHIPSKYDIREEYYVKITGEVNKPGAFAYGENMSVEDLVLKAGGLKESATNAYIEVARRSNGEQDGQVAEIMTVDIDEDLQINDGDKDLTLQPFDHVIIRRNPHFEREKLVRVEGEVFYPGQFAIAHTDERISDLLKRAGGINEYAYPKGATLIRRTEFFNGPTDNELRAQNLQQVKNNLKKEDGKNTEAEINILSRIDEKIGEKGGDLANQDENLISDEYKASRLKEVTSADSTRMAEIKIKTTEMVGIDLDYIMANPGSEQDLILHEGDILSIPKQLQTVRMRGEVLFPTTARFEGKHSFRDYIAKSGGFTDNARKAKAYVVYPNGDVAKTKKILFFNNYPEVEPGSEIIIPQKPVREGLSATNWIGVASSLATLAILVDRLAQ